MVRTGNYFDVLLRQAHLNWRTAGSSRIGNIKNEYEA